MKIKSKNLKVVSLRLIVPIDGLISVDAHGCAEVSPKCAAALVRGTNDWDYVRKDKETSSEETEEEQVPEAPSPESEEVEETPLSEREQFERYLDSLTMEGMRKFAEEGGSPREEWEKISTKKLMKVYLLKKFDESAEAEETPTEE